MYTSAQEIPPISIFQPKTYKAEAQNWAISQSQDKFIYVANNSGLLEFNGAKWQLYPSPNESIVRSVKVIGDKIFSGCYMEFGYWQKNNFGNLDYTSLSNKIASKLLEDEEFWNILKIDKWVIFQSLSRLYVYDTKDNNIDIIDSETRLNKAFNANETIYFQGLGKGFFEVNNGKANLISDHAVLKEKIVVDIFYIDSKLLFLTQDNGFYWLDNNQLNKWNIAANKALDLKSVYSCKRLKDGSFVLGTISNGVLIVDKKGEILYEINQLSGLSNNTVLSVFEDDESNIWLGLDNGLNMIDFDSPFKIYNDYQGIIGTTYASIVFNGNLYVGTNQGLFYKKQNTKRSFKFIEGTKGQVWSLKEIDNTLFCGHHNGTYIIEGSTSKLISQENGTWDFTPLNDNLILQGNYSGLFVLEKQDDNTWFLRNKINGFNISSKHVQYAGERLLFVSHEYKGVFKVELDANFMNVVHFGKAPGVSKGVNSSLVKFNDTIYYAYKYGIFKYNSKQDTFVKDATLSSIYKDFEYTSGKLIAIKEDDQLWAFGTDYIYAISKGSFDNNPKIESIVFPSSFGDELSGYENISKISKNNYLVGSSYGYVVLETNKIDDYQYAISINKISSKAANANYSLLDKIQSQDFKYKNNYFHLEYSIPLFNTYYQPKYQYKLEGLHKDWSNWSTETSHSFENLPSGNYTFKVRAKVGNTLSSNEASYSFKIEKPFYKSNVAMFFYLLGLLLFSLLMHNIYRFYYRKKQKKLLTEAARKLELKQLENQQQAMRFKNEKLEQDIENKNRELAISTMSLIKKNEFLNLIKGELNQVKDVKDVKPVVRLVDKNLNNTDDWKFFEEAFNNADKDFLKNLKAKHSNLTPNDLKLCAYLRLNLSSKEIAPLLNISVKSVEVKRYRLRKKMNLDHESSLTNYILGI
ncbi:LuxR family transcriptional regulator [Mangrovimonas spongiae]|uniref:LuxR family transcriptional regulator n=1 Tax=Mangrovimonas spongiae TaxID=2494697 RepID=A0A428K726_9FLAO|nr:LuxR family transcriptional regulator [Mangrovimonas spongiae]